MIGGTDEAGKGSLQLLQKQDFPIIFFSSWCLKGPKRERRTATHLSFSRFYPNLPLPDLEPFQIWIKFILDLVLTGDFSHGLVLFHPAGAGTKKNERKGAHLAFRHFPISLS